jgi:type II secretory pathway pseudopilin PulG
MIALLIVAFAVVAVAAVLGATMISRSRGRKRREELARARQAAAERARQQQEARRAWVAAGDDDLTSVMPAIKLPWPTQTALDDPRGYPELDPEYPDFDRSVIAFEPDYPWTPQPQPQALAAHAAPPPRAEAPPWPDAVPRDEEYIVPPARAAEYPSRSGGDHIIPPPRPVEYPSRGGEYPVRASDRAHRRVGQGSHRGGHAKRRRG